MAETRNIEVDEIRIAKFSTDGYGEKVVTDAAEIDKIVTLIGAQGEECPDYVHSPQLTNFRIELYKGSKPLTGIGVAGDFVCRDGEWYFISDSSLEEELMRCTEDVPVDKVEGCTFA